MSTKLGPGAHRRGGGNDRAVGNLALGAPWTPLVALSIIFGSFVLVGLPAAVSGGCYRSWFSDGRVYWECPSRFYGRNDSCRVADLAEFQELGALGPSDSSHVISYRLVLRDGTVKPIERNCFGDRDAFIRLTKENRRIMFTQLAK